jgi:prepilin-type N-terminal cleavage/methylation domain-containing protein
MDTVKRAGFTLVEMLAVVTIMAIMMAIAVGAFMSFGRGAGLRGSTMNVQTSLNLARQRAITYREKTLFAYGNLGDPARGWYTLTTNGVLIGGTNYLSDGLVFTNPAAGSFVFDLDGSCDGGAVVKRVTLMERDREVNAMSNVLSIYPLTGRVKSEAF